MAKLSIELDKRTIKEGRHPVRFRLYVNNSSTYIYTDVYASEEEFTGSLYQPIQKKAYMAKERNEMVGRIARKYDEVVFGLEYNNALADMNAKGLREYITGVKAVRKQQVKKETKGCQDFIVWFDEYSASRRTDNSVKHYCYVGRLLREFCMDRGERTLLFDDVDYATLCELKQWLRNTGRGEQTRFKVESYVRAAYREGAKRMKRSRDKDPFFDYKIEKVPEHDIEVMSIESIRKLISLDLTNQQGAEGLERTRDILLASLFLGGVNLIDLYNMQKAVCGEVRFVRHKVELKTQRQTKIRIEAPLAEIISRNEGRERLFYWGERYANYVTFQRNVNERCERLSRLMSETVNLALIRRSYATIAAKLEVPRFIIDKLMGHTDNTVLDKYYAQFDWVIAAEYNKKVIDYIMEGVVANSVKVPKMIRKAGISAA